MAKYMIRLDDFCPTNNLKKWEPFFSLFDEFDIKPIIAVIPSNTDPKLMSCGTHNVNYWPTVRYLSSLGYAIGMHGYEHQYQSKNSGLLKINNRSEFAGLPYRMQEKKIRSATAIFKAEGVPVFCFVAPAHSFDHNTLKALRHQSPVRVISDGVLNKPYKKSGFNWIPAQLSEAVWQSAGTWTFNFHPETCSEKTFNDLRKFVEKYHRDFVKPQELSYKPYTWFDSVREFWLIQSRVFIDALKYFLRSTLSATKPHTVN